MAVSSGRIVEHRDPLKILASNYRLSVFLRSWIDIRFSEFVRDPLGEIEPIYRTAEIELSPKARAGMKQWVLAHPRNDLAERDRPTWSPIGSTPMRPASASRITSNPLT